MELDRQKDQWLKVRKGYQRKTELIRELEELEKQPDLASVINLKRRLDHELDTLEHVELDHAQASQKSFIQEVANSRPDLLPALQQLVDACEESARQLAQIRMWIDFYESLLPHLAQILYLRRSSSGFGMIKYLFGQRPTNLITEEINKIKILLTKQVREYDNPLFQKLYGLVQQRWNFKQIDNEYSPLFAQLEKQHTQLVESEHKAQLAQQKAEIDLFSWLENI